MLALLPELLLLSLLPVFFDALMVVGGESVNGVAWEKGALLAALLTALPFF